MMAGPFSTIGKTGGELSAYIWQNIPDSDGDYVALFASLDGRNFSGTAYWGNQPSWEFRKIDLASVFGLGSVLNKPQVWVALWFHSDGDNVRGEGAYVDDVVVKLTPVTPVIVDSPAAGVQWEHGEFHPLKWRTLGSVGVGAVGVQLYKGGVFHASLANSIANDGEHDAYLLESFPPGKDYQIKITVLSDPSKFGFSQPFEITLPPDFTVIKPNGGEQWQRTKSRQISWSGQGYPGNNVKIELLKNNAVVLTIADMTPNDSLFNWTIPAGLAPGTDYRIRISSTDVYLATDNSNADFSLVDPTISVFKPSVHEWWEKNKQYEMRWTWNGGAGTFSKVELFRNGAFVRTIAASVANAPIFAGYISHKWTVDNTLTTGPGYTVKVTSLSNGAWHDSSESFSILDQPGFGILTPNGGESLTRGLYYVVEWGSTLAATETVRLSLHRGGAFDSIITTQTANDGAHTWTIPVNQATGTDYRVMIHQTASTSVLDLSDADFRIGPPRVSVKSPKGGEVWLPGSEQTVPWTASGEPERVSPGVRIELIRGDLLDSILVTSMPNSGRHLWTVPLNQRQRSDYRVKITPLWNPETFGISEARFTIVSDPRITLLTPNGGERLQRGRALLVRWSYQGLPDTDARIELLNRPGGRGGRNDLPAGRTAVLVGDSRDGARGGIRDADHVALGPAGAGCQRRADPDRAAGGATTRGVEFVSLVHLGSNA